MNKHPNLDNLKPFKPGESGNPNGRPAGRKNIKTMLIELLSAQDPDGEWAKLPAAQLVRQAFKDGNFRALVEILDRIEGKPLQKNENTGESLVDQSVRYTIQIVKADGSKTDVPFTRKPNKSLGEPSEI